MCLTAVIGLMLLITGVTQAPALASVRAAGALGDSVSGLSVSPSTTAAGATEVSYTVGFTSSASGALATGTGTMTLSLPAGSAFNPAAGPAAAIVRIDDLTSGTSSFASDDSGTVSGGGATLTVPVPVDIAAGDSVVLTYTDVTSAGVVGPQEAAFSTSGDTTPVSAGYTLTAGNQPVSAFDSVSPTSSAAGALVSYTADFVASPTGALAGGLGTVTLSLPAGSVFNAPNPGNTAGGVEFDVASRASAWVNDLNETITDVGATLTVAVPFDIAAGEHVTLLYTNVLSADAVGAQEATFSTSSDTRPVTAAYTLTRDASVTAPAVSVSSQQPGGTATYTVTFTTSATGALDSYDGSVTLAAATGTVFGPSDSFLIDDITSGQTFGEGPGTTSNGGATVTVLTALPIAAGDQVRITATGVTNPAATSVDTLEVSTSSDTVPAAAPYSIGDSAPIFIAGTPPLVVTAGASWHYTFSTISYPPSMFSLAGAPGWLSIDPVTGELSGTAPAGTMSFSYSVAAANSLGTATEGPYTVTVGSGVTVSGSVVDPAGAPVADVDVDACETTGSGCESATTDDTGTFSLPALAGSTVVLTAYPPPGSGVATTSTAAITVPGTGLTGLTITAVTGLPPLAGGLEINGSRTAQFYGTAPVTATYEGCPDGLVSVTVEGPNVQTGQYSASVIPLPETPPGSGHYAGTIPPQWPIDGPASISDQVTCLPQGPLLPSVGPATGGTQVLVTGSGFSNVTGVTFGGVPAPSFNTESQYAVQAVAPPGSGTVPVTVHEGSTTVSAGSYTYEAVTSISPSSGPASGNTGVIITGTGLGSATSVRRTTAAPQSAINVAETLAQAIGKAGEEALESGGTLDSLQDSAKLLLASLHPQCSDGAAAVKLGLGTLMEPITAGLAEALIPQVEAAVWAAMGVTIAIPALPEILFLVGLMAPFLVKFILDTLAGWAIDSLVDAAWANLCPATAGFAPNALIDPSGSVLDTNGHPVSGATVTILRSFTRDGAYLPVSISSAGILPAVNPETTGADGVFHWDVSAGYYKVQAVKPGCSTVVIGPYPVPPPQVGLTITLQCANEAKAAAPTVTSLSAGFGPAGGGTVLTLLGTNFTPSSKVTFGTTAAKSVTYLSPQDLTVTASKGSGLVDVRVTTAGGTSAPQAGDRFYFGQAPSVSKISPASGPSAGGTTMTITGANFTGATAVSFGGVAAKKFTVKSATSIVAVTAKGNAGAAPVEVANPAGPSTPGNMATFSYLAPVTAYVTTAAGLVPVSIATGKPGGAIKVTGATGVATTPDGDIVYVTDSKGVTPVSTVSGQPGNPIPVGKTPRAVAVAPDGKTAYAVNYGSGTVTPIDLATGVAGKAIPVGGEPDAIVTTPNGKTAYVANYASGTVTPITVATAKPGKPIKVGTHPDALAVTPNGATLYVANYGSNSVTPVAVATGKPGKPIKVGTDPDGLAITPNGKTLYVANGGSNTVTPVAVATSKAGKAITVGKDPVAAAITPDGTTVYVLNHGAGTITPLVTATGKAGRAITVGKEPVALAITR